MRAGGWDMPAPSHLSGRPRVLSPSRAGNAAKLRSAPKLKCTRRPPQISRTGSDVSVIIQKGAVNFTIPARSWHGLRAEIKLASGNLGVDLMPGFSGDIDAEVLRTGEIKSTLPDLEPRERNSIGPRS